MNSTSTFLVISGGSACNHICDVFGRNVSFVLGISDNGGSTVCSTHQICDIKSNPVLTVLSYQSELLRVLSGPSIGDLRSRLIRLMDVQHGDKAERMAIRELLSYR